MSVNVLTRAPPELGEDGDGASTSILFSIMCVCVCDIAYRYNMWIVNGSICNE